MFLRENAMSTLIMLFCSDSSKKHSFFKNQMTPDAFCCICLVFLVLEYVSSSLSNLVLLSMDMMLKWRPK